METWPLYVVTCGLLLGYMLCVANKITGHQRRMVMVAIGLCNSGSLPMTLIQSLQQSGQLNSLDVDPNALLSIYLITHPMLLWGLGSFLLTYSSAGLPDEQQREERLHLLAHPRRSDSRTAETCQNDIRKGLSSLSLHVCQPPVFGALLGLAVLSLPPVRAALLATHSPLKWVWNGVQSIASSAVRSRRCGG